MSSIPGYTLEQYLAWLWSVRVEDSKESNVSLGIAEMLGSIIARPRISKADFAILVSFYEPYREAVEDRLLDFDEETMSWRSYSEVVEYDIPKIIQLRAKRFLLKLKENQSS